MLDGNQNKGLPAFLVGMKDSNGLHSGLMAVQYSAAALASENKVLAHPATVDTIPTSAGMEDFVSMSPYAGLKARMILQNTQRVLAIELICSAQALDLRGPSKPGKGTRAAYNKIREGVPMVREDRMLSRDIEALTKLVSDGGILQAVDAVIGPLQ